MPGYEGIIAAIITPFTDKGELFEQGLVNELTYLSEKGIKNIFACGSYGSFPVMTPDQRMKAAEITLKIGQERKLKTIMQIGSTSTSEAVKLAKHAEGVGADALAAVVPFYYSTTIYNEDYFLKYYEEIIQSVGIPVHLYNNPNTTGFNASPAFLGKLIDVGLRGIKDGGSDMGRMVSMLETIEKKKIDFDYYPSSTSSIIEGMLLGAKSFISGVSLSVPELINDIYNNVLTGDLKKAMDRYKLAMKVRSILGKFSGRAIAAYDVLYEKGVDVGTCKKPWQRLTKEQAKTVIDEIRKLGMM